jgi:hypothetical protein
MDTEKIQLIMRQTDYTEDITKQKLLEFDNDHIKVIKDFMGISEKHVKPIVSINQEIYKQLRHKLDDSIRVYNNVEQNKLSIEIKNNNS